MNGLAHYLPPACHFLAALGVRNIARKLGLAQGTVSNWNRPADPHGHNNSTGGYIPPEYWPALVDLAQDAGLHHLTLDLLRSKTIRDTITMANRNAQKGTRFEREMIKRLDELQIDATRVALSGAAEDHPGDLKVKLDGRELLAQCKISSKGDGYVRVMQIMREVGMAVLDAGRRKVVVMHLRYLREYVEWRQAHPVALNYPTLTGDFSTLRKALDGHELLFFRRNKDDPYVAMEMA